MFTARHIKDLMEAQPFKPFRIFMSDGRVQNVPHHDAALVTRHFVEVGTDLDAEGLAENVARCAILHITRIEDVKPRSKKK